MNSTECPAVLTPESTQPWPIFAQPRHRLVAGSQGSSTAAGSSSSVATVAGSRAWFVDPFFAPSPFRSNSLSLCRGVAGRRRRRRRASWPADSPLPFSLSLSPMCAWWSGLGLDELPLARACLRKKRGFGPFLLILFYFIYFLWLVLVNNSIS